MQVFHIGRADSALRQGSYGRVHSASTGSAATRAILLLFTVVVVAIVVIWGISSRAKRTHNFPGTHELAIPTVTVIHPSVERRNRRSFSR